MAGLEKIFEHALELPSISKVVQELIDSFNDPRVNIDAISKKLRMDQALSAKVLRLANSARYGTGRRIASIDSAVVMLGIDALRTLVVASGVTGAFRKVPHLDIREFWRETFLVAAVCKSIARHAGLDQETAFTCGLLHSLGEVLLHIVEPDTMVRIDNLVKEGASRTDLERNQMGFDYAEVGEALARRWNFPEHITAAIGQHTRVMASRAGLDPYALIIHIAKQLVRARLLHLPKARILADFPAELAEPLHLNMVSLMEELDSLMAAEDDIDQVLAA